MQINTKENHTKENNKKEENRKSKKGLCTVLILLCCSLFMLMERMAAYGISSRFYGYDSMASMQVFLIPLLLGIGLYAIPYEYILEKMRECVLCISCLLSWSEKKECRWTGVAYIVFYGAAVMFLWMMRSFVGTSFSQDRYWGICMAAISLYVLFYLMETIESPWLSMLCSAVWIFISTILCMTCNSGFTVAVLVMAAECMTWILYELGSKKYTVSMVAAAVTVVVIAGVSLILFTGHWGKLMLFLEGATLQPAREVFWLVDETYVYPYYSPYTFSKLYVYFGPAGMTAAILMLLAAFGLAFWLGKDLWKKSVKRGALYYGMLAFLFFLLLLGGGSELGVLPVSVVDISDRYILIAMLALGMRLFHIVEVEKAKNIWEMLLEGIEEDEDYYGEDAGEQQEVAGDRLACVSDLSLLSKKMDELLERMTVLEMRIDRLETNEETTAGRDAVNVPKDCEKP